MCRLQCHKRPAIVAELVKKREVAAEGEALLKSSLSLARLLLILISMYMYVSAAPYLFSGNMYRYIQFCTAMLLPRLLQQEGLRFYTED